MPHPSSLSTFKVVFASRASNRLLVAEVSIKLKDRSSYRTDLF